MKNSLTGARSSAVQPAVIHIAEPGVTAGRDNRLAEREAPRISSQGQSQVCAMRKSDVQKNTSAQ